MQNKKGKKTSKKFTRRQMLKTTAAAAGYAACSGAITGFPVVWAQKLKKISLLHVGGAYSAIIDIARQASKDLGFKIEMQNLGADPLMSRVATQPKTMDIADLSFFMLKAAVPRGVLQAIDVKKIKNWNKIIPIFTKGKNADGTPSSMQGSAPYEIQYLENADAKSFAKGSTKYASLIPTIYNADTLGIRPDLIGRKIEHWHELLNPEFKGKAGIIDIASVGMMDAAMAIESRGDIKYGDKGNMTKEEIDKTIDILKGLKRQGHWRSFWTNFDESVNLMAAGEVIIQSMWSPAVTAVRARGIPCLYVPLKEGYRAWGNGLGVMRHLSGLKLEAAYEYLNWYLSGWQGAFVARQGYYSSVPETAKAYLSEDEWDYWYEGKLAKNDIKDPYGKTLEKAGHVRDGGAFWDRMGKVACWNAIMDENRHMVRKWNEFIAS